MSISEQMVFEEDSVDDDNQKTEEQILRDINKRVSYDFPNESQQGRLIYLSPCILHQGPRVIRIAQAVIIRRYHNDPGQKGFFVYLEYWKRGSIKSDYYIKKDIRRIEYPDSEQLLQYLMNANITSLQQEDPAVLLPATEIFNNLTIDQRQTFASLLSDVALTHRLTYLFQSGQLSYDALNHLAAASQQIKYKKELDELKDMVYGVTTRQTKSGKSKTMDEHGYQKWFDKHHWVFGTEYVKHLKIRDIDTNAKIDFAFQTVDGFIDVLELKTPDVEVLQFDDSHKTWFFSKDVAKVLAQAAKYLDAIERRADAIYRRPDIEDKPISFIRPRVRIVIGRSYDWNRMQHEAFRRLATMHHCIELFTFDHIIAKAEQLVARYDKSVDLETINLDDAILSDDHLVIGQCEN